MLVDLAVTAASAAEDQFYHFLLAMVEMRSHMLAAAPMVACRLPLC